MSQKKAHGAEEGIRGGAWRLGGRGGIPARFRRGRSEVHRNMGSPHEGALRKYDVFACARAEIGNGEWGKRGKV